MDLNVTTCLEELFIIYGPQGPFLVLPTACYWTSRSIIEFQQHIIAQRPLLAVPATYFWTSSSILNSLRGAAAARRRLDNSGHLPGPISTMHKNQISRAGNPALRCYSYQTCMSSAMSTAEARVRERARRYIETIIMLIPTVLCPSIVRPPPR